MSQTAEQNGNPVIESGQPFDSKLFRNALGRFASGVTVVTAHFDEHTHGMTANAFVSVSLNPPSAVSLDNRSNMHRMMSGKGRYGISVLAEDQEVLHPLCWTSRGRTAGNSSPVMEFPCSMGAVAYFVVRVTDAHPAGDHTLYIGQVGHFETSDGRPLLFHGGRYHRLRSD